LRIKKSGIVGARKGLFAARPYTPGDRVTSYTGDRLIGDVTLISRAACTLRS
jgi:hypothetical protein